jgi:cytochrome P450
VQSFRLEQPTHPPEPSFPPGPRGKLLFGHLLDEAMDLLGLLVRAQREHGDVVFFRLSSGPTYLLSHPEHARHVLVDNVRNYRKPMTDGGALMGRGLFTSDGEFWLKQRRLVQPAFHRERLALLVDGMVRGTQDLLERWQPRLSAGTPFDAEEEMMRLTLSILCHSVFSDDVSESAEGVRSAIQYILKLNHHVPARTVFHAARQLLPSRAAQRHFSAAVKTLDRAVYGLIAERRKAPTPASDLMAMLLEVRDAETGEGMSDKQLRDELMTLVIAGHEATALSLVWTLHSLARHPEVEQRVRDELAATVGTRPVRLEDLPALRYTRAVLDEVMRLNSAAWLLVRRARAEDTLGGWRIPAGAQVYIAPYILHRHPSAWERPDAFLPERFMDAQAAARHRHAYLPFGGGQRLCIGNNYALMKMTAVLATLMQRCQLRLAPKRPVVPVGGITYRPRDGLWLTAHPAPEVRCPPRS